MSKYTVNFLSEQGVVFSKEHNCNFFVDGDDNYEILGEDVNPEGYDCWVIKRLDNPKGLPFLAEKRSICWNDSETGETFYNQPV